MKLIRLPSGPLACVFAVDAEPIQDTEPSKDSGVYRAFSGSVEADGQSESDALRALDEEVRRLSQPPAADIEEFELTRSAAANDVRSSEGPGLATTTGRYARFEHETLPAPASSSRR